MIHYMLLLDVIAIELYIGTHTAINIAFADIFIGHWWYWAGYQDFH